MSTDDDPKDRALEVLAEQMQAAIPFRRPSTFRDYNDFAQQAKRRKEEAARWRARTARIIQEHVGPDEAERFRAILPGFERRPADADLIIAFIEECRAFVVALMADIDQHGTSAFQGPVGKGGAHDTGLENAPRQGGRNVFMVHGHDEAAREKVARTLEKLELDVTILHEQPNQGRSILGKLEANAEVDFVVVLLTGDDEGRAAKDAEKALAKRPRQNVVLELGFFLGRLGAPRVCALMTPDLETPSDYDGVVYIALDQEGGWKQKLVRELQAAGIDVDANRLN